MDEYITLNNWLNDNIYIYNYSYVHRQMTSKKKDIVHLRNDNQIDCYVFLNIYNEKM